MEKTKGNAQETVIPVQLHKSRDGLLDSTGSGSSRSEGPVGGQGTASQLDCPDGGLRAWLVVLGVGPRVGSSLGYITSWGVFQSYYEQTLLKDHTPSSIAWIGSLQVCLVFLPGLISGRLFDLGIFKLPFVAASALLVTSTFLVAECTQYWQFVLCQGLATGLGVGMVFGPSLSVLGHWFKRKRGAAMGLTTLGSSVGGTVFPIATRTLIPAVGFPWTMRILAFILLFSLCIPCFTLARRLPPKAVSGGLFNFRAFKDSPPFTVYCVGVVFLFLGLFTVMTYIDISAVTNGVSPDYSFYLVSIVNASSLLGRVVSGILVDKTGAINFIAPTTFLAGIVTFAWPFATSKSSLTAIAVTYGFTSGTIIPGLAIPVFLLGDVSDIGRRTGMMMTLGALGGLFGAPISGAINRSSGGFKAVGYFAGTMMILAGIFMLATRYLVLRKLRGRF
ncbi:major facilitator superfamily domain-containing protein [Lentinula edodes]|uniref:major facilitator superfamily domain-containing protein n=1 Tax=Lentinula edodes TaxID=5353 RepID=UPI001E8E29B1|nr:major facilitator superfamily domain-containing protein [Lentinula edodes]KAH7875005.1 major facilitator superfamily domain-containing protein [Lentinula edodes]